jgi:hypothetical protein
MTYVYESLVYTPIADHIFLDAFSADAQRLPFLPHSGHFDFTSRKCYFQNCLLLAFSHTKKARNG